jgi:hypothetical protein
MPLLLSCSQCHTLARFQLRLVNRLLPSYQRSIQQVGNRPLSGCHCCWKPRLFLVTFAVEEFLIVRNQDPSAHLVGPLNSAHLTSMHHAATPDALLLMTREHRVIQLLHMPRRSWVTGLPAALLHPHSML